MSNDALSPGLSLTLSPQHYRHQARDDPADHADPNRYVSVLILMGQPVNTERSAHTNYGKDDNGDRREGFHITSDSDFLVLAVNILARQSDTIILRLLLLRDQQIVFCLQEGRPGYRPRSQNYIRA